MAFSEKILGYFNHQLLEQHNTSDGILSVKMFELVANVYRYAVAKSGLNKFS